MNKTKKTITRSTYECKIKVPDSSRTLNDVLYFIYKIIVDDNEIDKIEVSGFAGTNHLIISNKNVRLLPSGTEIMNKALALSELYKTLADDLKLILNVEK